jgi:hypothetical protein
MLDVGERTRVLFVETRPPREDGGAFLRHLIEPLLRAMNLFVRFEEVTHHAVERIERPFVGSLVHNIRSITRQAGEFAGFDAHFRL